MDRTQRRFAGVALPLVLGSCGDDVVTVAEPRTARACARGIARGHWNDGTKRVVGNDRHVCLCMTEAEFESGARVSELNDLLLAGCDAEAEVWAFDWTECQERHDSGDWVGEDGENITWPTSDVVNPPGVGLICE